jgi:hypothetical protein
LDRRRRRAAALGFASVVAVAAAGALALAAPENAPIRAMLWASKDADPARAFGSTPTECLKAIADPRLSQSVEIGRAAFRTPVLLGGQAARAGVMCETCHKGGRSNPDFLFPGVSGAPGTADVTDSLFSSHRGDDLFDPKAIPDLSASKGILKVDQTPAAKKLEPFLHGLVTEEFDGPEPPPAVLAGLAAYVRALDPKACPAQARRPITLAFLMSDVRRALTAGETAARGGDAPTAVLMTAAARSRLGLIDERYAGAALGPERQALRKADGELSAIQAALRAHDAAAPARMEAWLTASRPLETALAAKAGASLFNPQRLAAAAAKRRLPGKASGV